jgi:hypothetical protein
LVCVQKSGPAAASQQGIPPPQLTAFGFLWYFSSSALFLPTSK